jgi:hypothetical protein
MAYDPVIPDYFKAKRAGVIVQRTGGLDRKTESGYTNCRSFSRSGHEGVR